jgi:hypothetical protein
MLDALLGCGTRVRVNLEHLKEEVFALWANMIDLGLHNGERVLVLV